MASRAAIGVDYSTKRVDLAVVDADRIVERDYIDLRGRYDASWLEELQRTLGEWTAYTSDLYLEKPWHREGKGSPLAIHRIAHFVEAMAILASVNAHYVAVPTWRSAVFGRTPRRPEAKRTSLAYVRQVFGFETADDNLADAICLAAYGQRAGRLLGVLA